MALGCQEPPVARFRHAIRYADPSGWSQNTGAAIALVLTALGISVVLLASRTGFVHAEQAPLTASSSADQQAGPLSLVYRSPMPESTLVSPDTANAFRAGTALNTQTVAALAVSVTGSKSGSVAVDCVLSSERRTVIVLPKLPFAEFEDVTISTGNQIRTADGRMVTGSTWRFATSNTRSGMPSRQMLEPGPVVNNPVPQAAPVGPYKTAPADLPVIATTRYSTVTEPGLFFLNTYSFLLTLTNYVMIVEDSGEPIYYKPMTWTNSEPVVFALDYPAPFGK